MVDSGNIPVFEDLNTAADYVLAQERSMMSSDPWRQSAGLSRDSHLTPFSSYFNNAPEDKFIYNSLMSGRFCFKPNLRERKCLFRGQTGFHDPCTPGMFRDRNQKYFIKESVSYQELYLLILSHPLVQLMDLGVEIDGSNYQFETNLYGLAQHYYNKTTLIDLTSDIEVAKFFACCEYHSDTDSYTPIEDETGQGVLYYYEIDAQTDFKPGLAPEGVLKKSPLSTIGLQVFPRSGRQKGFLYNLDPGENFNSVSRLHCVAFKHKADISRNVFAQHNGGAKLLPDDILSDHWLKYYSHIRYLSENALEVNHRFNANKTIEKLRSELMAAGVRTKFYRPCFTEEELSHYYDESRDLWRDMWSQVYIPGDRTNRLLESFMQIPDREEYRWAFEPGHNHSIDYRNGYLLKRFESCLH